jgi:ergosteryl-3beta-O-L-aspartate synthase
LHNVGHKRRHLENYILKARKAQDQASDSKSSSLDGNHKSEHNGDKAIRGGLESDVKGKIAQLETPPNESDKDSRDRTSRKKALEDFEANDEPAELREWYGRLPLVQSREELQETWTSLSSISTEMVNQNVTFRACLHTLRRMSPKLVFLVFREQISHMVPS